MTLSDRAIIFLVCALLSAVTIGASGVLEDNNVFKNKIFEKRGQQIANSVDLMMYTDEGEFEKRLSHPMNIDIYSVAGLEKKISINSDTNKEVTFNLDTYPSDVNIENAKYICVQKEDLMMVPSSEEVEVSKGQC